MSLLELTIVPNADSSQDKGNVSDGKIYCILRIYVYLYLFIYIYLYSMITREYSEGYG